MESNGNKITGPDDIPDELSKQFLSVMTSVTPCDPVTGTGQQPDYQRLFIIASPYEKCGPDCIHPMVLREQQSAQEDKSDTPF